MIGRNETGKLYILVDWYITYLGKAPLDAMLSVVLTVSSSRLYLNKVPCLL